MCFNLLVTCKEASTVTSNMKYDLLGCYTGKREISAQCHPKKMMYLHNYAQPYDKIDLFYFRNVLLYREVRK